MNKRYNEIIKDYADSIKTEIKDFDIIIGEGSDKPKGTLRYIALEEGDNCPEVGCTGIMAMKQTTCCCSTINNPPCSACENSWLECDTCNYDPDEIPF